MNRTRHQMQMNVFLQRRNIFASGIFNNLAKDFQLAVTCNIYKQHCIHHIAQLDLVAHMSFEDLFLAGGWAKWEALA